MRLAEKAQNSIRNHVFGRRSSVDKNADGTFPKEGEEATCPEKSNYPEKNIERIT